MAGLLTGLAIATRTGGIITHAYLLAGLLLCAAEFFAVHGRVTLRYLFQIGARYACHHRHRLDDGVCALAVAADRQSVRASSGSRSCTLRPSP